MVRNSRVSTRVRVRPAVTDLIPTMFVMIKSIAKIKCTMEKMPPNETLQQELSSLESSLMKMTLDVEYLSRKGR